MRRFFTAGAAFFSNEAPFLVPFTAVLVAIVVHLSRKMGRYAAWILLPRTQLGVARKTLPNRETLFPAYKQVPHQGLLFPLELFGLRGFR